MGFESTERGRFQGAGAVAAHHRSDRDAGTSPSLRLTAPIESSLWTMFPAAGGPLAYRRASADGLSGSNERVDHERSKTAPSAMVYVGI